MRVCAVSRIDDDGRDNGRRICRGTFRLVAHDNRIYPHRFDCIECIAQTLPLYDARRTRCNINDIGAEIFSRKFEGCPRARARLIEQGDDGFPAQGRHLFNIAPDNIFHFLRRI